MGQSLKMKPACADQFEGSAIYHFTSDVENNCKARHKRSSGVSGVIALLDWRQAPSAQSTTPDRKPGRKDALVLRQLSPAHCPETLRCLPQRFATWLGRTSFETHPHAPFRCLQRCSPSTALHLFDGLPASCRARATSSSRPTGEECLRRAEGRVPAAIALQ